MSKVQDIDVSNIALSSTVFPTKDDMAVWDGLSAAQREAYIVEAEARGAQSGVAPDETLDARLRAAKDAG